VAASAVVLAGGGAAGIDAIHHDAVINDDATASRSAVTSVKRATSIDPDGR
jgi:hypothetical protein